MLAIRCCMLIALKDYAAMHGHAHNSARQWADDHLTAEQYQAIFGEVVEDDSRTTLLLSLPVATVKKIKRNAAQAGLTVSAYVESKF